MPSSSAMAVNGEKRLLDRTISSLITMFSAMAPI
jgi:hypothetical protein